MALGAGACNKPLVFTDPGIGAAGGVTGVNNADAGTGGTIPTGSGGVIGAGGTLGTGGTGGIIGTGGAGGSIDAAIDQRVDVPPDVRDTGPDIRDTGVEIRPDTGPITTVVCSTPTDCSSKLAGLTCLIPAGQPGRCVECVATNNCPAGKVCDSVSNRCVECVNAANDCPSASSEHGSQCSTNHRCLNGCSDDTAASFVCPSAAQMCITGSMGSGPDICVYCTTSAQCGTGGTCLAPGVCVTCQSDTTCAATNPAKPLCDTTFTGNCVQCKDSRDCVKYPGFPLCDPIALICKAVP